MTYTIGSRVIVKALRQRGKIASVSETPSGKTLLGIVLEGDEERAMKRKKGAVDVYMEPWQLDHFDSVVEVEDFTQDDSIDTDYIIEDINEQDSSIIEED